jgi:hypothetical protein
MTVEVDTTVPAGTVPMTRAQIGQAMSGLYISIFVAILPLGGTIGVSALGAVLAGRVGRLTADGLAGSGVRADGGGSSIPRPAELPAPVRAVIEDAYGHATGDLFVYTMPLALVALVCVFFIREVPLRTSNAVGDDHENGAR